MSYKNAIKLDIPEDLWENSGPTQPEDDVDDPSARMFVTVTIGGVLHYLEAYAVTNGDIQAAVYEGFENNIEGAYQLGEPDKRFETVEIKGREYILVMTPYC